MRLSTLGRYALRAMVDLAKQDNQSPTLRREIADRQEISSNYLAQLFLKLRRAGLIRSILGPGGGYVLAKSPSEISAGDVLRAVEEPLAPVYCVDEKKGAPCHRADGCPTRVLWKKLGEQIVRTLDSTTLADLCEHSPGLVDESAALGDGPATPSSG